MQYPGAINHVINRGDRREPICKDDLDRRRFIETLGEACAKTSWQIHGYCLMDNHFHLVLETPLANLVAGMNGEYLGAPGRRPGWLRVDRLWGEMGIPKDSAAGRRQFERMTEERRQRDEPGEWKAIRRGWCLGEEQFRQELLEAMSEPMGRQYYGGAERRETDEAKAERIVAEELKRRKWDREALSARREGDKEKVKIAKRLRGETTMTLSWIAQRLTMGSAGYAAQCLREGQAA